MNQYEELLARCHAWIVDSRWGGHTMTCTGSEMMPEEYRGKCNCGLDKLLLDVRRGIEAKPFRDTNGSGKPHEL